MGISIVTEALAESRDDEKKYRQETGGQRTDPNLLECCKLLEDMSALLVHIENVELSRDRYSESTRTSGLGTPLHSPDGMREEIELEEGRLESFCKSAQILTTVEVHTSKGCQEVNNNNDFTSLKNVDDLEDDESFVLHL
uniref:Uncharacterized protein n=1 Tax=Steinernema glaseri TaxID=37863 RepID=A0A1I7Y7R8_9BILA